MGGTFVRFREALAKTIKEFFNKDIDAVDIRTSICAAVSIKVEEPSLSLRLKQSLGRRRWDQQGPQ